MARRIENTAQTARENPLLTLLAAMGGIEAQEAAGQRDLVHSDQIPTRFDGGDDVLLAMGFQLGPQTPGDKLFREATLPPGWSKQRTDHSMWSMIVDDKGRERLTIFYKAAFYDRDAFMRATVRFSISARYQPENGPATHKTAVVYDGTTVLAEFGPVPRDAYDQWDQAIEQAKAWLAERYPEWQNPAAYWD